MKIYIRANQDDEYTDEFLEQLAYETCDLEEEFDESEFVEFKEACKSNGFDVTNEDFKIYLSYVKSIRGN